MFKSLLNISGSAIRRSLIISSPSNIIAGLCFCSLLLFFTEPGSAATVEDDLLRKLGSASSAAEKDAICADLKRVATPKSVASLAPLLMDEQLSHSARYVLETLPGQEASKALVDALDRTDGSIKLGLIQSLGIRRDSEAVAPLSEIAQGADPVTADGALAALGEIGGAQSARVLLKLLEQTPASLRQNVLADAALRVANDLVTNGNSEIAADLFRRVYNSDGASAHAKAGAFRGLVLSAPEQEALDLLCGGLRAQDGPAPIAALQLVPTCTLPSATKTFAALLPEIQIPSRIALIQALQGRGDPAAAGAITPFLVDPDANVRAVAIAALGRLGGGTAAVPLAELAANSSGAEQLAAREALTTLAQNDPDSALMRHLSGAKPAIQAEIAKALAGRGYAPAVPSLLSLARAEDPPRTAALQALAALVKAEQVPDLIDLVVQAPDEPTRASAAEALNSAYQRILRRDGSISISALAGALSHASHASPQAQRALLEVCAELPGNEVWAVLRSAVASRDELIRDAGIRAMCESRDPGLFTDLAAIAVDADAKTHRTLALAACSRFLSTDEARLPRPLKLQAINSILTRELSTAEKKLLLAGLAEMGGKDGLAFARQIRHDGAVEAEANRAVLTICASLPPGDSAQAIAALSDLSVSTKEDAIRKEASSLLEQIHSRVDYLTEWQVSGPYREPGKNFAALFDFPFSPEISAGEGTRWQQMASGTDPNRPIVVDLLKRFGGEQCVAYVRAWVHATRLTPCVLELGSDDGAKVWLNGALIHANNTARPVQCGSDKINAELKPGWNLLLMKITQNNLGWEFCARFVKPDGSRLEGLRSTATAPKSD